MKKLRKIIAAVAICAVSFSAVGCKMIEKTPEAINNQVYAIVGDTKITRGEFQKDFERNLNSQLQYYGITVDSLKEQYGDDFENSDKLNAQLKSMITSIKTQTFTQLINTELMLQQTDFVVTDEDVAEDVDSQINKYKEEYAAQGDTAFTDALTGIGETEESFRESLIKTAKLNKIVEEATKDIEVTDDEMQTYYDENKDSQFKTSAGADCFNIVIAEKDSDGNIDYDASLTKANEVKAQIDAGEDFGKLAAQYNTDSTKDNGGSLGFVTYDSTQYVQEFIDAFKELKEGEVSSPVKSQFGYHIIKATGLKDEKLSTFDEVKDQIKSNILQEKQNQVYNDKIEEWKKAIKVTVKEKEFKDYDKAPATQTENSGEAN